jgi:ribosomal-protein-alanine N-acetyltransferase
MHALATPRLLLLPAPAAFLRAVLAGDRARASAEVSFRVPEGWPEEADFRAGLPLHLAALEAHPSESPWRVWLVALRAGGELIGNVSFKRPPDSTGSVELGWGIALAHRRQGLATEAVTCLLRWACQQPGVRRTLATIPEGHLASEGVARKAGMVRRRGERRWGLPVWACDC